LAAARMAGVGHANNSGALAEINLLCLGPWTNPNTRHESRSGRCPGGAWAAPLQPQRGQGGEASPEPRDAKLDEALVLAPDAAVGRIWSAESRSHGL